MIPNPLHSTYRTNINIRPIKSALAIGAKSAAQFREAALDSCTTWGGITNLIVPVGPGLDISELDVHLLHLHEPDVVISYLSVDTPTGRARHDRLRLKLQGLLGNGVGVHAARWGGSEIGCHPLNAIPDDVLSARQFLATKFVASSKREETTLLALFGQIYPGQEDDYVRMTRFGEQPVGFDDLRFWAMQASGDPLSSPISLTGFGVSAFEVTGSFGSELFELVLGDDLESLCYFWNLRATRVAAHIAGDRVRRVMLAPTRLLTDRDSLTRLAEMVRALGPSEGVRSPVELLVLGAAGLVAQFDATARNTRRFRQHRGNVRISRTLAGSVPVPPKTGRVAWMPAGLSLPMSFRYGVGFEGQEMLPFTMGKNDVRVQPPARYVNTSGQPVMLDFDSDVWSRIPKSEKTAHAVDDKARWTRHGLSLMTAVTRQPTYRALRVPDEGETLRAYFADRGLQISETKLSGYLDAVIRLLGGFSDLSVLASRCAFNIIDELATRSPKKIAQRLREDLDLKSLSEEAIAEKLTEAGAFLDISRRRTLHQLKTSPALRLFAGDVLAALAELTARGVVRRGIAIECRTCGSPAWHTIASLDEQVECPGCGERQPLPAEYPEGSGAEIPWSYALNALVDRAWDQDLGPVLLTLHHVASTGTDVTCRGGGIEVTKGSNVIGDLDFVMYRNGQIHAGEVKAGTGLAAKDSRFARTMLIYGVDVFYFASVRGFSKDARQVIETMAAEFVGDPPRIVMLGPDLLFAE